MPYIAGYLDELGASSYSTMAAADKAELAKSTFGLNQDTALTEAQQNVVDTFVQSMDATVEMFDEYIGETSDFTYHIKVSAPVAEPDSITLTGLDEFDNDVNINEYELRSYDEIYRNGAEDAQAAVQSMMVSPLGLQPRSITTTAITALPPATTHTSIGRLTIRHIPAIRATAVTALISFLSVSMLVVFPPMQLGKPILFPWIRASAVPSYMVKQGLCNKTSYTNATAGSFAYTSSGAGHAVLVTINDGAKIAYTAPHHRS